MAARWQGAPPPGWHRRLLRGGSGGGGARGAPRPRAERRRRRCPPPRGGVRSLLPPLCAGGGQGRRSPSPAVCPAVLKTAPPPPPPWSAASCFVTVSNTPPPPRSFSVCCSVRVRVCFWAFGSRLSRLGGNSHHLVFSVQNSRTIPAAFGRETLFLRSLPLFLFPSSQAASLQVPPAALSLFLALPAGLRNFCPRLRWPFICDFFSWAFRCCCYFSFPATTGARPGRRRAGRGPSGGQRRPLPPPGAAWEGNDGLEIKQHF